SEKERTCYEIKSKVICIPRVVFPWQKAKMKKCASCDSCDGQGCTTCIHNGARLRRVCVDTPKKYTCPTCKYTWEAKKKGSFCDALPFVDKIFTEKISTVPVAPPEMTQEVRNVQPLKANQPENLTGVTTRFSDYYRAQPVRPQSTPVTSNAPVK
ncbi:MAG: hypothetical protein AAGI63_17430, partial [Planctomycetota bacterium]